MLVGPINRDTHELPSGHSNKNKLLIFNTNIDGFETAIKRLLLLPFQNIEAQTLSSSVHER